MGRSSLSVSACAVVLFGFSAAVISAACTVVETTDTTPSTTSTGSSQGGMPSVAAATTTVGSGGAGGDPNLTCFPGYQKIPDGECDLLQQNCPDGFGCEPKNDGTGWRTHCVISTGVKGPGDSCVNNNSCRAGLHCVFNKCTPICCPTTNVPCLADGGKCNVTNPFGGYDAQVCSFLDSCNLFTNDCPADYQCYPLMSAGNIECAPVFGTTKGEGEACGAINECNDSMICDMVCRWACYLDGSNSTPGSGGCPAGQTCVAAGSNPPQNIGQCQ